MTDIIKEDAGEKKSLNFIEQAIENDLKEGKKRKQTSNSFSA
jgi:glutaminyl-tRNA synthetase